MHEWNETDVSSRLGVEDGPSVVPWSQRDQALHLKLRKLFAGNLKEWVLAAKLRGQHYEEKWHVGRAMLDWFYEQGHIDADEFERANARYSRPNKPSYAMYRISWIDSGRASDEVASICSAPRTGPSAGYQRGRPVSVGADRSTDEDEQPTDHQPPPSPRAMAGWHADLTAEREIDHSLDTGSGWVYCWGYEMVLEQSRALSRDPLVKIGHTTNHYVDRIRAQVRGVACPDAPKVLRAYRVLNSAQVESEVHRLLKQDGRHHWRAGGTEWFVVHADALDQIVDQAVATVTNRKL